MIKRITAWLLTFSVSLMVLMPAFSAITYAYSDSVTVSIGSASGKRGDTVKVTLSLTDNKGLNSLMIKVKYDAAAFECVSISDMGKFGSDAYDGPSDFSNNPLRLSWTNDKDRNTDNGDIAAIDFIIKDSAVAGDYNLELITEDGNNFQVDFTQSPPLFTDFDVHMINGKITVSDVEEHIHSFGSEYKFDERFHWRECSCGEKTEIFAHTANIPAATETENKECTVCGYVIEPALGHTHRYSAEWKSDSVNHWHECSCGDKADIAAHTPNIPAATETESKVCTVCGYVIEPAIGHTHGYSPEWKSDSINHWHECACGDKADIATHIPNIPTATETENKICTVCGYMIEAAIRHTHSYSSNWKHDSTYHWRECLCGDKADFASHVSNGGIITVQPTAYSSGTMTYSCSVCGYVIRTEAIPPTGGYNPPYVTPYEPPHYINPVVSVIHKPETTEEEKNYPVLEDEDIREDISVSLKCKLSGLTGKNAHMETKKKYFDDSAVVRITNSDTVKKAASRAIDTIEGGTEHNVIYPFDISIYNAATNEKMRLKSGGYITFEIPVPKSMADNADNIKVYHISGDTAELIDSSIETADGITRIRFKATDFSPYMFTLYSEEKVENVAAGAGVTANSVPVDTAAPVTNGVGVPVAKLPRIMGLSGKKRRYRILRKRKLSDLIFVY